ncbi:hypothetical protein F4Z99_19990 [Candidatus Poribacteria bacterium]|nr:hypothetical protein [Candidatus Poribacteria bacterium]
MSTEKLIPIQFSIQETSDPNVTIDGDNDVSLYIGRTIELDATFELGGPPMTEAQIRNSQLLWYTDAERQNRLGADDEALYQHEFTDINMSAGTAKVRLTVNGTATAQTLYANLRVMHGA